MIKEEAKNTPITPNTTPNQSMHQSPYKSVSRGFPVQPGQTWHDLTAEQKNQWFRDHESRWKMRFMAQNAGNQANMSLTRG